MGNVVEMNLLYSLDCTAPVSKSFRPRKCGTAHGIDDQLVERRRSQCHHVVSEGELNGRAVEIHRHHLDSRLEPRDDPGTLVQFLKENSLPVELGGRLRITGGNENLYREPRVGRLLRRFKYEPENAAAVERVDAVAVDDLANQGRH